VVLFVSVRSLQPPRLAAVDHLCEGGYEFAHCLSFSLFLSRIIRNVCMNVHESLGQRATELDFEDDLDRYPEIICY